MLLFIECDEKMSKEIKKVCVLLFYSVIKSERAAEHLSCRLLTVLPARESITAAAKEATVEMLLLYVSV